MGRRARRENGVIYPILLMSGFLGLVVMAAMGFMHGHGHHGHHGHGHHGHTHGAEAHGHHAHGVEAGHLHGPHGHGHAPAGHTHAGTHGHAAHHGHALNGVRGHSHQGDSSNGDGDADASLQPSGALTAFLWLMPLLSPLNWFSWMLGAGAAGGLASGVPEPARAGIAVGGALLFNLGVVKPLWNLIFSFASQPARNLEGCLMQEVEAVTSFDERGEGLVRVCIDGQSEDVLARLVDGERGIVRIRRGDRLLIEEVDPRTNSCRVSRG